MKTSLTLLFALTFLYSQAQLVDFENFDISMDSFLNGSDLSGGFISEPIFLPNEYNTDFDAWSGWAISNRTDSISPGFGNQYSVISGSGAEETATYALTFAGGSGSKLFFTDSVARRVQGFYINNSTYTYYSLRDGDAFAKQFGGPTGMDPDFFSLTIKGYQAGSLTADSILFYLADFRSDNSAEDYIIEDWTWVDCSELGLVDSLAFVLNSSDVGMFGMNTPGYFCLDQLMIDQSTSTGIAREKEPLLIYPNPSKGELVINEDIQHSSQIKIYTELGRLISTLPMGQGRYNLSGLPVGKYLILYSNQEETKWARWVKM